MKKEQIAKLVNKYFRAEGYQFPGYFEHRYDPDSSAILYSLIRHYNPKTALGIGTWYGGSTCVIMAALLKNLLEDKEPFQYVASELLDDMREKTKVHCFDVNHVSPTMIEDITKNLDKVPEQLDFLFVDTDHDLPTTIWIVENIFPRLKKGALVAFHDWAVWKEDGKLIGKGEFGEGGWPETTYLMGLIQNNELPLKEIYWTYKNPAWGGMNPGWESAYWLWQK